MGARFEGATILLTGASSGIGRAMARQLAPRAARLLLVARRTERLEALKAELVADNPRLEVRLYPCDLGDLGAAAALCDRVQAEVGEVGVLINNAGIGEHGAFDRASWASLDQMIRVNVNSLALLTHRFLPAMIARGQGGVLNVSSGFGLNFLPGFATYIGTKHFVTGFTDALRVELHGTGVAVSQVCPGPVATEFEARMANAPTGIAPGFVYQSEDDCAREALDGLEADRGLVLAGTAMKLIHAFTWFVPRWLRRLVLGPVGQAMRRKELAAAERKALPSGE
jgi:hypothetical protein